jgi:hypothetical protein
MKIAEAVEVIALLIEGHYSVIAGEPEGTINRLTGFASGEAKIEKMDPSQQHGNKPANNNRVIWFLHHK